VRILGRLDRFGDVAPLLLRLAIGPVLAVHGGRAVVGGMEPLAAAVRAAGGHPALAYPAAYLALAGGVLLTLGLGTRWAALAGAIAAGADLVLFQAGRGPLAEPFQLRLLVLAGALALVLAGPGRLALDRGWLKRET